jgi:hypothetical protein
MHGFRWILPLILLAIESAARADEAVTVEVAAGETIRQRSLAQIQVPKRWANREQFELSRLDTGERIPVQVDRTGSHPQLVWIVRDELPAGATRQYQLVPAKSKPPAAKVRIADNGRRLLVTVEDKPVLAYNHATVPSPNPDEAYYARSGYIHPLYNPAGQVVTDDFNPDHPHQHGIMLAWRKMLFEGRETNGWDQKALLGRVEHAGVKGFGGGPVFGFVNVTLKHIDLTAPEGPKTALNEAWLIRIYALDDIYLFDITSTQSSASPSPVTIEKYHYGGMTIRGHADWHDHRTYDFLTDDGKTKLDGNQTRPRWVDLFGPIAGKTTGVTIMDHPGNMHFPQPTRLHPTMPYFCFVPAAVNAFTISPRQPLASRYRFAVHNGKVDPEATDRLWNDFAHPPQVQIIRSE